jgi:hypothetical protein
VEILLNPGIAIAIELAPFEITVLTTLYPIKAAIVLNPKLTDVENVLIGSSPPILDKPGPIIELIVERPGSIDSDENVYHIIVLKLLAPGTAFVIIEFPKFVLIVDKPGDPVTVLICTLNALDKIDIPGFVVKDANLLFI